VKIHRCLALVALMLAASHVAAAGTTLYTNDFESGSTANFSYGSIQSSLTNNVPDGREHFLGYIWGWTRDGVSPETASTMLTLDSVGGYSSLTLAFDLYALDSLDGDDTKFGPDFFGVEANGVRLIYNSFSNASPNVDLLAKFFTNKKGGPITMFSGNGWAVPKGSPLAAVLQKAVQNLIDNGKYLEIAKAWGVEEGAITKSVINGAAS